MGKYTLQIPAQDGCVYLYDVETCLLRRICDISDTNEVPEIVKETLRKAGLKIANTKKDSGNGR
ncbi:MAG: hypothetical protein LBK61_14000 [Spirochaetaceae bacterium]|jgi:hypothetical protein|nr:hypothetical protein [Spirochaetaceae bacterium]